MSEQIELKNEHIVCTNWYILGEFWKKEYREMWKKSNINAQGKSLSFKLNSKIIIENISDIPLHFYDFFYIREKEYSAIMRGKILKSYQEKSKMLSEKTYISQSIFKGESCIIPTELVETKSIIYKYANARFKSKNDYGYRAEAKAIDELIKENEKYIPTICDAKLFVKTRGATKPEYQAIERNISFIESTTYREILRKDISLLNNYKKLLEDHLDKVNSCITYKKNI